MLKTVKCIHFLWWWTSPFDLRIRKILCLPGDCIFGFLDYWQYLLPLPYCRLSPAMHPWPSGVGRKGGLLCAWVQVVGDKLLGELLWVSVAAWVSLYQQRSDPGRAWVRSPCDSVPVILLGALYTLFPTSSIPNNRERNPGQQPVSALTALIILLALTCRTLKD